MITKDMPFTELMQKYPQAIEVLFNYGMGWIGCVASQFETIEQGALAHGIDPDELVKALNEKIQSNK